MSGESDPRVYFAAERTLLAWVRTGLTVIGLGFVVSRFNLFLRMIHPTQATEGYHLSTVIGIGLALLGSASVAMAAWQHVRFTRTLGPADRPRAYLVFWPVWFAVSLSAIGVILAIYIAIKTDST